MNGIPTLEAFWALVGTKLIWLGILTIIDFVFGVTVSLVQKKFEWNRLTGYLTSDVLPIFAWLASELIGLMPISAIPQGALVAVPTAVYATVFLVISGSIAGHFAALGVLKDQLAKIGVKS